MDSDVTLLPPKCVTIANPTDTHIVNVTSVATETPITHMNFKSFAIDPNDPPPSRRDNLKAYKRWHARQCYRHGLNGQRGKKLDLQMIYDHNKRQFKGKKGEK